MPTYYYDYHHKDGYELATHLGRELRHSHRPTTFIVNSGRLVIDDRTLEDHHRHSSSSNKSNAVIYNAPGSTMYIEHHKDRSRYPECRGCFRRREPYSDGYCFECISAFRLDRARRHEVISRSDRRYLEYPERRAIAWR